MVVARRGMVATSNPLASQAGLAILRRGGKAADAAVAAAAVLNVTESASTGIGGDMFALTFDAKTKQVTALNGSGRSPAALTLQYMRDQGYSEMPLLSPHSVTVPGAVAGWEDLLKRHGSMTLADVLTDAIHYARDGFPVHPIYGAAWLRYGKFMENAKAYDYIPGGQPPQIGQVVQLPGLAEALQAIADGGSAGFYTGKIAEAIVKALQARGGLMTLDDLKNHRSTWEDANFDRISRRARLRMPAQRARDCGAASAQCCAGFRSGGAGLGFAGASASDGRGDAAGLRRCAPVCR